MVKKKKIIKRVTAMGVVALLLLVAIAPVILPAVDAMVSMPGDLVDGEYVIPEIGKLLIPLDRFSYDTGSISVENPFASVAFSSSREEGYSPPLDYVIYNYGDANSKAWEFGTLGVRDTGEGFHVGSFSLANIATSNGFSFSFSNSSQFIIKLADLNLFLNYSQIDLPANYELRMSVTVGGYYPYQTENKQWHLGNFIKTYSNSVKNTSSSDSLYSLPTVSASSISGLIDDDTMLIVNTIHIQYFLFVSLADASASELMSTAKTLRFPYSTKSYVCNISDFWTNYPCETSVLDGEPGSMNFNLGAFLRQSVGSFFATEIIPGLSFGGMLSVSLGISFVCVFLKFFGG